MQEIPFCFSNFATPSLLNLLSLLQQSIEKGLCWMGGWYTVTKSKQNEASLWKITLQKRKNSHVATGTFIPALTQFLYILLCGKSVPVYGREYFTGLSR
jgi:hypothetical protein